MIIKRMDSKQEEIRKLETFLKDNLTSYQRFLIERELKAMRSGVHAQNARKPYQRGLRSPAGRIGQNLEEKFTVSIAKTNAWPHIRNE